MLSQEATAMAGLSGTNLGTILALIVDLVSIIILAYALSSSGPANEQNRVRMETGSCRRLNDASADLFGLLSLRNATKTL